MAREAVTTWVLLRGLARESGHWGDFPRQLQRHLGDRHRVLTLDAPGNGARCAERSPIRVADMAHACRAALGAVDGPVRLVALSLGAMVALEWARQAPHGLAGCALINTSLRGHSPFWQRLQPRQWWRVLRLLRPGADVLWREQQVLQMTSAIAQHHGSGLPALWAALAQQRPVSPSNAARQLVAAARYRAPQAPPPVPLLVVCSEGDQMVSPRCSQHLALRWRLPLRLHPWAGHDLPLDDPDWLCKELLRWAVSA